MPEFRIEIGTPQQNSQRVLRGGNWINNARYLRSAIRNANSPDNRNHNIGLRLAGALLDIFKRIAGGSVNRQGRWKCWERLERRAVNQWCLLFSDDLCDVRKQNQDPQRVSRRMSESLLLGRLFLLGGGVYAG